MLTARTAASLLRVMLIVLFIGSSVGTILLLFLLLPSALPSCSSTIGDAAAGISSSYSCTYRFGVLLIIGGAALLSFCTTSLTGVVRYARSPLYLFWTLAVALISWAIVYGVGEFRSGFEMFDGFVIILNIILGLFPPLAYRYILKYRLPRVPTNSPET